MTATPPTRAESERDLLALAKLYAVQGSYTNMAGRRVRTRPQALLATLRALGAPVDRVEDVGDAIRARRLELMGRAVEPVVVAWNGWLPRLRVRLPAREARRRAEVALEAEDGTQGVIGRATLVPRAEIEVEGKRFAERDAAFEPAISPHRLPFGYHRLTWRLGAREERTWIVSAPRAALDSRPGSWGVFLPLYALRTRDCWGVGDVGDLVDLTRWVAGLGGNLVATLPLFPAFLDGPVFDPSPYSPVSRLFWNELYADLDAAPGMTESKRTLSSEKLRREVEELRAAPLVDYERTMRLKRRVLEAIAVEPEGEFAQGRASDYAAFRANMERRGTTWWNWPRAEREGTLPRFGGDRHSYRYHLFAQWLMGRQMAETARQAAEAGGGLYFDLPVGVHSDGYDVWREREAFVVEASAGAPPDMFFSYGQDWGFPPAHPDGDRSNGYRYFRATIAHLFRHAAVARIDHVMGLNRLFVVPRGMPPSDGAYVRYRPHELYAIMALESHRHGTVVVGEDLGTVPARARTVMRAHGVHRSYVMQFELSTNPRRAIREPPEESLAALNTHDTPTFAAFWRALDVRLRVHQGWMDQGGARAELEHRDRIRQAVVAYLGARDRLQPGRSMPSLRAILRAALSELAGSDARIVVANLEDLWLETLPQNVPGTTVEYPNWRRPARYSLEQFSAMRSVIEALCAIELERAPHRPPAEPAAGPHARPRPRTSL